MKIAIVGFGATGVNFFIQLVNSIGSQKVSSIYIVSKKEEFIGGKAFGSLYDEHIINTHSNLMSCYASDNNHFINWLQQNKIYTYYPPRKVFKQYLVDQYEKVLLIAKQIGIKIHIIDAYANEVSKEDNKFHIILEDNNKLIADKIVYTSGEPPRKFESIDSKMLPFHSNKDLSNVSLNEKGEALVLGAGLSAIDAIFSLGYNKKVKCVHLYSRSGLLPTISCKDPISHDNFLQPIHFTKENLEKLLKNNTLSFHSIMRLICKDLQRYKTSELQIGISYLKEINYIKYYETILGMSKQNYLPLQFLLNSSRYYFSDLWIKATLEQKIEFKKFERSFLIFRNSIPYENGKKLLQLFKNNKLKAFKISKIEYKENSICLVSSKGDENEYPVAVNSIVADYDIEKSGSSFDKSLIKNNIVETHNVMGLIVDPLNCKASDGFYIAGQRVKGVFYTTNAFWFNQKLCTLILKDILKT